MNCGKIGHIARDCKRLNLNITERVEEVERSIAAEGAHIEYHFGPLPEESDGMEVSTLPEFNDCLANIPKVNVI